MVGIRSFPFGFRPIFRGKLAVSFRVCINVYISIWRWAKFIKLWQKKSGVRCWKHQLYQTIGPWVIWGVTTKNEDCGFPWYVVLGLIHVCFFHGSLGLCWLPRTWEVPYWMHERQGANPGVGQRTSPLSHNQISVSFVATSGSGLAPYMMSLVYTPSLKLTASLHLKMDGWNTSFLLGLPIFRGYVSFGEGK